MSNRSTKPILVDSLVSMSKTDQVKIGQKWYVSRPINVQYMPLRIRIKHAIMVLVGTAHAHQYKEDRINQRG